MNIKDYISQASKFDMTKLKNIDERLLHYAIGLFTEMIETLDEFSNYSKSDDVDKYHEIGDVLWYCAMLINCLNEIKEEIMVKCKENKQICSLYNNIFNCLDNNINMANIGDIIYNDTFSLDRNLKDNYAKISDVLKNNYFPIEYITAIGSGAIDEMKKIYFYGKERRELTYTKLVVLLEIALAFCTKYSSIISLDINFIANKNLEKLSSRYK